MKSMHMPALLLALLLAGCEQARENVSTATERASESMSEAMDKAVVEARHELATQDFDLDAKGLGLPRAHITPKGELVVDGKTIATTPEQQKMLLEYRAQIMAIAEAGIETGTQGAELAGKAVTQAVGAVFNGKSSEDVKRDIEREAGKVAASAKRICDRLPALLAAQQKLADSLPEFKPYARMDQKDVDECHVDAGRMHADLDVEDEPSDQDLATEAAQDAQAPSGVER